MREIPALNEILAQSGTEEPEYPGEDKKIMVLYDEDHHGFGSDFAGNIGVLLDEENAREVKRLAEEIISKLEDNPE